MRYGQWKIYFHLIFIKYLSYSEVKNNNKVFNVKIRSLRACSKSVTEKFLVRRYIFKFSLSLWELQVIRDLLCLRGISEKSLNRMLLLLILKTSRRKCSVKMLPENLANFTGKYLCWSLFLINLHTWGPKAFLKRDSNTCIFQWNLRNFWEHLFWSTFVNLCFCIFR